MIDLSKIVLRHFQPMLTDHHTFQFYFGGRGGGKSVFVGGEKIPLRIMSDGRQNCVVFRQNEKDHLNSTYAEIKAGIERLGDAIYDSTYNENIQYGEEKATALAIDERQRFLDLWEYKLSPLKIIYKPFGNKIIFKGFNDPTAIKSIKSEKGYFNLLWLEEGQAIANKKDFDFVNKSFRGKLPDGVYKEWFITFNSPLNTHWLRELVDNAHIKVNFPCNKYINEEYPEYTYKSLGLKGGDDKLSIAHYSVYCDNPYLSDIDRQEYERDAKNNKQNFEWEVLGEFGSTKGHIYNNWEISEFSLGEVLKPPSWRERSKYKVIGALDIGFVHPTAFYMFAISKEEKKCYIFDGFSAAGLQPQEIAGRIISMGYGKERIICDNAVPATIKDLRGYGINNLTPVHKYKGTEKSSIMQGIFKVMAYKIYVRPNLLAMIRGFNNYVYDEDKYGNSLERPVEVDDDEMDTLRYAIMWIERPKYGFAGLRY